MSAHLVAYDAAYRVRTSTLVEDIRLAFEPGVFTVIAGPNGAGKSSLLKLLAGEVRPTAGRIELDGRPLSVYAPWELACRRALMAQSSTMAFDFTAFGLARIGAEGVGRGLSAPARDRVTERALQDADAAHLADRSVHTLSGGERQRVQFARALVQLETGRTVCGAEQQILFLDEPTASLDLKHQLHLITKAKALARSGRSVIAVMHDLALAAACADRLLVMRNGRCVGDGPPREVLTPATITATFQVVPTGPGLPTFPWTLPA
jgi:iron complex transport system ATP-binding protein